MVHGWNTSKTGAGFAAKVYRHTDTGVEVLQNATFPTRAKAMAFAKKWVLYYRRKAA